MNSLVRLDTFDPAALLASLSTFELALMGIVLLLLAEGALLFAWSPGKVRERLRSYDTVTVILLVLFFVALVRRILGFL